MKLFSLEDLVIEAAAAARPPERLTVSQAAEKYRRLNNPGAYVGPWKNETTPYLVEPMDILQSTSFLAMAFAGPAQCGKALALDTPIPTPTGWTNMGSLTPGQRVLGSDGSWVEVTAVSDVFVGHDCFRVEFDDGSSIVADADHLWAVRDVAAENEKVLTTRAILEAGTDWRQRKRFRVKVAQPLTLSKADLDIDPYVMGLWLGDGSKSSGFISVGDLDRDATIQNLESRGCRVSIYQDPSKTRCDSLRVVLSTGEKLVSVLRLKGWLAAREIPRQYLRASEEQRRELMRGLMDSDGSCSGARRVEFYQTRRGIAEGFFELAASLGFKPRLSVKAPPPGSNYAESHRVSFSCMDPEDVFSLERKQLAARFDKEARPSQFKERSIVSVVPVPSVPTRCIRVSADDHLFLAGKSMIPTHNTDMVLNWIGYSAKCDPADMMVVQTSNITARDFSIRRIDRLHRHSPEFGQCLLPGKQADNTFDKHYAGMLLNLAWPSINELSGKPIPRQWITDYDRMPEDVDGEGSAFDLTRKRGTTYGRYAMTAVESSPGFVIENPKWTRKTRHEAPPTRGILAVYNRGDRRRWLWPCVVCKEHFEPSFELLKWVDSEDIMESAESVHLECPYCQTHYWHEPRNGMPGKHDLNQMGRWIRDGQVWKSDGSIVGTPVRSDIASFWLKGVAAAFSNWKGLVFNYLNAEAEYERTGAEEALKSTVNVDQGEPYLPKSLANERVPEEIKARAVERRERMVPNGIRFLIACIDVQKNRFVVQVHGIDDMLDIHVIDRFEIKKSKRVDEDGDQLWVNPGAHPEDWKLVAEEVIQKTYPLEDDTDRHMGIKLTVCDSGGKAGVTANAYGFVRWLRNGPTEAEEAETDPEQGTYRWEQGMNARFALLKGASTMTAPRVAVSYPDSQRKDRDAGARGEIPVWMINTNTLKDMVDHRLDRKEAGGRFVFPKWLPDTFYIELTVEVKDAKKGWQNPRGYRNESWDLLAYCMAATLMPSISLDHIDFAEPPGWAADWDSNDLVFNPSTSSAPFKAKKKRPDLAKLASDLA